MSDPTYFIIVLFCFLSMGSFSQDTLHYKDGEKEEVKVLEVSENEIKYKKYDALSGPAYTVKKAELKSMVLANGKIETFAFNPRSERKFGISTHLLGPSLILSMSVNYYVTSNINLEAGYGLIGFYGGMNFYFGKENKDVRWAPYIGGKYTNLLILNFNLFGESSSRRAHGVYVPAGVQLMTPGGFTFAPEVAAYYLQGELRPWGSIKLGYNF